MNNEIFIGGPPPNNELFIGGPPTNNELFVGGPPTFVKRNSHRHT